MSEDGARLELSVTVTLVFENLQTNSFEVARNMVRHSSP